MKKKFYDIMISDLPSIRWKRHLLFWLAVWVYHFFRIWLMVPYENKGTIFSVLFMSFTRGVPGNIFFTYSLVYFLIPRFLLTKKYVLFIILLLLAIFVLQVILNIHFLFKVLLPTINAIGLSGFSLNLSFVRGIGNPPLIFGLFLSLKTLKNWHVEQLKTLSLAKENTNAELQLLKAQIHPHFLFNTLNNIYSFTLNGSPQAANLLRKLSDLLYYMIHECDRPLVPLEKEIKLLRDYIGLEKVRYGNRLDIEIEVCGKSDDKLVAPLLMIPFLENCFKHGASLLRGRQWIRVSIQVAGELLEMEISNTKPAGYELKKNQKGIGLVNVRKRLSLLYPARHFLQIIPGEDVYIVKLQLELTQISESKIQSLKKLEPVLS